MIRFRRGNLLHANTDALVNTVNTVGIMGKGIALAFKEAFPENYEAYRRACDQDQVRIGEIFVYESSRLWGPKWILNFPTKRHWKDPSRLEWIESGLASLRRVIQQRKIRSIAIPPLGCGNGGLAWTDVRGLIQRRLENLDDVEIIVYEPTDTYFTPSPVEKPMHVTPARALVTEAIRRYETVTLQCSILEVQKLAYFLSRIAMTTIGHDPLQLKFLPHRYGPYSDRLRHLLADMNGTFIGSDTRIPDATPTTTIHTVSHRIADVRSFLDGTGGRPYREVLENVFRIIDGFESPLGMELLATVDWLVRHEGCPAEPAPLRRAIRSWPGPNGAGARKAKLFSDDLVAMGLTRLRA